MIGLTTLPCFGAGKVSSDSFSQGFKGLCPIRYFVARRMERFTGISRGQWSSSQIFLVQSRVYAINLLFATVVLEEAFKSVYPKADVQHCVIHKVRHRLNRVRAKDRNEVVEDLKAIY